jgi:hypothetical protein
MITQWRSAKKIQAQFRCYLLYKKLKQQIFQRQLDKITKFNQIQKSFIDNYRRKEISSRKRI